MHVYIVWKIKVIEADHDGYCSGADNEETIYNEKLYCQYDITKEQHDLLIWLYNECNIDEHDLFIEATKPDINTINLDCNGSMECNQSENGLIHQKQKTPTEMLQITNFYKEKYNKWVNNLIN